MAANILPIVQGPDIQGWQDQGTETFAEAASQTFVIGAPLTFTAGKVEVIQSVTAPAICGIALTKASGTSAAQSAPNINVIVPLQGKVFTVSVDTTTTSGTAALGTGTPANFNVGTNYQLLLDSTSGNYYMGTGTASPVFTLLGYDPGQATTVNGRVWVRILTSQTIYT